MLFKCTHFTYSEYPQIMVNEQSEHAFKTFKIYKSVAQ